jgi:tRNA U34 5-carboxymethylaminomethyl modifying enzyme MnmG/GidA
VKLKEASATDVVTVLFQLAALVAFTGTQSMGAVVIFVALTALQGVMAHIGRNRVEKAREIDAKISQLDNALSNIMLRLNQDGF